MARARARRAARQAAAGAVWEPFDPDTGECVVKGDDGACVRYENAAAALAAGRDAGHGLPGVRRAE